MSLEGVATGDRGGEAEELGGGLVAEEHIHATCETTAGKLCLSSFFQ